MIQVASPGTLDNKYLHLYTPSPLCATQSERLSQSMDDGAVGRSKDR